MLGERTATKQEEEAMNQPGDWLGILCCSCYNSGEHRKHLSLSFVSGVSWEQKVNLGIIVNVERIQHMELPHEEPSGWWSIKLYSKGQGRGLGSKWTNTHSV